MYDLEYANFDNPHFNSHEQFAYFRKHEGDLLLVVLNFHDKHLDTEVRIPPEAFQYLNLPEGDSYTCTNLLDEAEQFPVVTLDSRTPFRTIIPAWKKNHRLRKNQVEAHRPPPGPPPHHPRP